MTKCMLRALALVLAVLTVVTAVVAYWDKIEAGLVRLKGYLKEFGLPCRCCGGEYADYEDLEL
jgi:hypothetical protein